MRGRPDKITLVVQYMRPGCSPIFSGCFALSPCHFVCVAQCVVGKSFDDFFFPNLSVSLENFARFVAATLFANSLDFAQVRFNGRLSSRSCPPRKKIGLSAKLGN